jgi:hypothetical protein
LSSPVPTLAITYSAVADCSTLSFSGSSPAIKPIEFLPSKSMTWSSVKRELNGFSMTSIPELLTALNPEKFLRLKVEVEINICKMAPQRVSYNASRQSVV